MTYDSDIHSVYRDQYQTTRVSNHSAIRRSHRGLDIVSIDDKGLSDLSSDVHEMSPPPGPALKKPMRKLPRVHETVDVQPVVYGYSYARVHALAGIVGGIIVLGSRRGE